MKILYVTTVSSTVNAFLIPHIKMLIDKGHEVDVAFNVDQEVKSEVKEMGCKIHIVPFQRSPLTKDNVKAYRLLKKILIEDMYDLVHTHTPVASAIVRLVCRNLKCIKVIYTVHGFHFFKGAPLINWVVYYSVEKLLARYTDHLIAINKEDFNRANKFKAGRVHHFPGIGIDIGKFSDISDGRGKKRFELGIEYDTIVLLSIGELIKRKNHETALRALSKLRSDNFVYLICGRGKLREYLQNLVVSLGIQEKVKFLGFRNDINEICFASDILVFPSYQEGLPVAIMEAMSAGLPIIASEIRGNTDLIENGIGGYLLKPDDIEGFTVSIHKLLKDSELRKQMGTSNKEKVKNYDISIVKEKMREIYSKCISSTF